MRLPPRPLTLAGSIHCESADVSDAVWQEHVIAHPFGIRRAAQRAEPARWTDEGWHTLTPPLLDPESREAWIASILALTEGRAPCRVPEFVRGPRAANDDRAGCQRCDPGVLRDCALALNAPDAPGDRYRSLIVALLDGLVDSEIVTRGDFFTTMNHLIFRPELWSGLSVMCFGLDGRERRRPIARVVRDDGLCGEFFLDAPRRTLTGWRTLWRDPPSTPFAGARHILGLTRREPSVGHLSDVVLVPRPWWVKHHRRVAR